LCQIALQFIDQAVQLVDQRRSSATLRFGRSKFAALFEQL
jgi:hypothetical protein